MSIERWESREPVSTVKPDSVVLSQLRRQRRQEWLKQFRVFLIGVALIAGVLVLTSVWLLLFGPSALDQLLSVYVKVIQLLIGAGIVWRLANWLWSKRR